MSSESNAVSLGLDFSLPPIENPYLNLCYPSGNLFFTSGHVSTLKGKLGVDVSTEDAYEAAREVMVKILQSLRHKVDSLDKVRVVKLLGCVNSAPDFIDQHLVINGASDLIHKIFGKEGDGFHARSAVGFASLPTGVAVEIEAIFELKA